MLKNILKLAGAQGLTKNEQKSINGGMLTVVVNRCTPYQQQYVSCVGAPDGRVCYTANCQCPGQCVSGICGPED